MNCYVYWVPRNIATHFASWNYFLLRLSLNKLWRLIWKKIVVRNGVGGALIFLTVHGSIWRHLGPGGWYISWLVDWIFLSPLLRESEIILHSFTLLVSVRFQNVLCSKSYLNSSWNWFQNQFPVDGHGTLQYSVYTYGNHFALED